MVTSVDKDRWGLVFCSVHYHSNLRGGGVGRERGEKEGGRVRGREKEGGSEGGRKQRRERKDKKLRKGRVGRGRKGEEEEGDRVKKKQEWYIWGRN